MPRVTITVPEKNAQPYRFQLDRLSVTLGRGSENDIAIDCGSVSVKHAEMRRVEGGYELRDLGSTNGIKLDDERFQAVPLRNGMSLRLGDVAFDFLLAEEEIEALAQEPVLDAVPVPYEPENTLPKLPPLPIVELRRPETRMVDRGIGGYAMLLLLMLAVAAFFVGMAVRFHKETGGSLLNAIRAKRQAASAPTTTVIDTPKAATPDAATPDATPGAVPDATPGGDAVPVPVPDVSTPGHRAIGGKFHKY